MLKDTLSSLRETTTGCRIKHLIDHLEKDDATALIDAIRNPRISIRAIASAVSDEGITISRDSVNKGRQCANNPKICKCGTFKESNKK